MKAKLILTGIALIAFAAMAGAQEQTVKTEPAQTTAGTFVDTNNDGVCDNFTQNRQGQGLNQNNKANNRQGYRKGNGKRDGQGQGRGQGLRNGKGSAANFVDANKNGVCDRRE